MADTVYIVNQDSPENIEGFEQYSLQDKGLISNFQINSEFNVNSNYVELHILSLSDELVESDYQYKNHAQLGNAQSAGQAGASVLTIDPILDARDYGYENGGIKLLYHFLNDLYTEGNSTEEFYISNISPDRMEVALGSLSITSEDIDKYTSLVKERVGNLSYFTGFRLNFKNNDLLISTNIATLELNGQKVVVVRLYEPLPASYNVKDTLNIVEEVSDSVVYEVESETTFETPITPTLRSANFSIEISDESIVPTMYFNHNELLSYPVTNANNQVFSAIKEKGIDVNVDYNTFADFIHFSSAQERLLNFKYKVELIASYYGNLDSLSNSVTGLQGVLGSTLYYEEQIKGIVGNFDHYERHLYYESGSSSWPKVNNVKPYENREVTAPESTEWYGNQITSATSFDNSNYNSLLYTIPAYLREDSNNENYLTFTFMVGQHFDNLWLYAKAVTDKYDADNRPNFGISKDLVAEALKNFGVKLYTSNKSTEDLFTTFIGQSYQSGSEVINYYITGSLTGSNTPIQPTSYDSYQKEVQKRIYHNLPLLLKSKGTERGVRALINCFGIPSDTLEIKLYGGTNQEVSPFFGNREYVTSSLDKVRLDNTGSTVQGNTLSELTSIQGTSTKYTDDLHQVEIGFSPTNEVDRYITSQIPSDFHIDQYIGDPRNIGSSTYNGLDQYATSVLTGLETYDVKDYVRLIKFFDNVLFKMVKDFLPARASTTTGIIIKPNILDRSKARGVQVGATFPEYEVKINTAFITGSDGDTYGAQSTYTSSYIENIQTPFGLGNDYRHFKEEAKYDGELSGSIFIVSTGDLNKNNTFKIEKPVAKTVTARLLTDLPAGADYSYSDYLGTDYYVGV